MTSAITPGDFVECIRPSIGCGSSSCCKDIPVNAVVRVDRVWTDTEVESCSDCGDPDKVLLLVGDNHPQNFGGRCPCSFRPIHRPSASKLMSTLRDPTPLRHVVSSRPFDYSARGKVKA